MLKIVVMPVKNEAWILRQTLAALSLWADQIILADQQSEDDTVAIAKTFPKARVVSNNAEFHSSNVRKLLLDTARGFEGNNAIFSFDADEIPTAHILSPEFWQQVSSLPPNTALEFEWVQLWRSPKQYRSDAKSVWSNSWKSFGFLDDRSLNYETLGVINDHTSRVPIAPGQLVRRFNFPKVLHFQFTNWERLIVKQNYYRMVELIQRKDRFKALKINKKYFPATDERGLKVTNVPEDWTKAYRERGVDLTSGVFQKTYWFEQEAEKYINKYGLKFFSKLDIWQKEKNDVKQKDPRNIFIKLYHHFQGVLYSTYDFFSGKK